MDKIESRFNEDQPLHDRMDLDYSDWRLTEFVPEAEEGVDPEDAYTTNSMRTLADKVESFISGSEIVVRVNNDAADEQKRASNDNLERLVHSLHGIQLCVVEDLQQEHFSEKKQMAKLTLKYSLLTLDT